MTPELRWRWQWVAQTDRVWWRRCVIAALAALAALGCGGESTDPAAHASPDAVALECTPQPLHLAMACLADPDACALDEAPCQSDDPCALAYCTAEGRCASLTRPCDDANPCTEDQCVRPSGARVPRCEHLPVDCPALDDGCTEHHCAPSAGGCVGVPVDCAAQGHGGAACVHTTCEPGVGCTSALNHGWCAAVSAFEALPCLQARCDPAEGCVLDPIAGPCDDGDACTLDTICIGGACGGGVPVHCDDGDACTEDACVRALGCVNPLRVCDDGDPCTVDHCGVGVGCFSEPLDCDDGDACTQDTCLPELGCQHEPVVCTSGDLCVLAQCDPTEGCTLHDACDDGDVCTLDACSAQGACSHQPVSCADGSVCTIDTCDPQVGCVHTPRACPGPSSSSSCMVETCHPLLGCLPTPLEWTCPAALPCLVLSGCESAQCTYDDACADGDACTLTGCAPGLGCYSEPLQCPAATHTHQDGLCDPSVGCVIVTPGEEICALQGPQGALLECPIEVVRAADLPGWHAASLALGLRFDASRFQIEAVVAAAPEAHLLQLATPLEQANPAGLLALSLEADPPDTALTLAYADGEAVVGDPRVLIVQVRLLEQVPAFPPAALRATSLALHTPLGPAAGAMWAPAEAGAMVWLPSPQCHEHADCHNDDPCTTDTCEAGTCVHAPFEPHLAPGEPCTWMLCDPQEGVLAAPACDDGDLCTHDECDPLTGACSHAPVDPDDGDGCTADFCDSHLGVFHMPANCDDGSACTHDECIPEIGCVNTDHGCDDGVACTVDTCVHKPLAQNICENIPDDTLCGGGPEAGGGTCEPGHPQADEHGCAAPDEPEPEEEEEQP